MEESSSKKKRTLEDYERFYKIIIQNYLRKPREEDKISKLPDSLISQILSHLPTTKEAVRTSVLSKRWRSLYLLIPALTVNANEFPNHNAFVGFIDRFLGFSREQNSILHRCKLTIHKNVINDSPPCVTRLIDSVASSKLNHLDVECLVNRKFLEAVPQSLYVCDTLVYLRLHRVSFGEFESFSLPCLKTMVLEHNVYANDTSLELFISHCSVLEDLSIVRMEPDNIKVLRVCSKTLTSLHIDYFFGEDDDFDDEGFERDGSGVFINAPKLEFLKFEDDLSDSKIITNSGSLAKVDIVFVFSENDTADLIDLPKRDMIRNFFTSISRVTDLKLSSHIVEFLYYNNQFDPLVLPRFCNLSRLKLKISKSCLKMLPTLLKRCPNLKTLILVLDFDTSDEKALVIRASSVPRCLLSSLEHVEIKCLNGGPARMEVARYIVENSLVLKKLVLDIRCTTMEKGFYFTEEGFNMLRYLLALPRPNSTCQILLK
ncbi:FBD-associated F-box protein [Raphanus sativus]|uniref:FBD-associated F-box protein At5g22730-like n=1 Tax=Raphanus sativus TaxID=3726 RepID=A0A9W3DCK4_RAPSA|nr:FBD-associated F-box protein At5g22730-like [Raphanus sativus]KAJ4907987.1 FBD-associated F-box protein [Raphanus sativus]